MPDTSRFAWLLAACSTLSLASGCADDRAAPDTPTPPLRNVEVRSHPTMAVAADVTFESSGFSAARVRYASDPASTADDAGETPIHTVTDGVSNITVLGLLADTPYRMQLDLLVGNEVARTVELELVTPDLPEPLRDVRFATEGDVSWSGYLLTDVPTLAGRMQVAFDALGRVRWYYGVPLLGNFSQRLANGNFGVFVGTTTGWQPTYGYFLEVTPAAEIVARHQAPAPLYTDEHELLLHPAPGGWSASLFSYDIRTVRLPSGDARLAGHQILRYGPSGQLEFLWNAWDHIDPGELVEPIGGLKEADFDHPNSMEFDSDGDYVVSFRNLSQVMKIDADAGAVLWRLGGRRNEFTWVDDPLGGFSAQHSAIPLGGDRLLVFDNGTRHFPQESRAVEYELDVPGRTARLVWEYRHDPPIYTPYTGSVQRLSNGNTVVGFAFTGIVTEVDPGGTVVWEGRLTVAGVPITYRMKRIGSLYDGEGR